MIDKTERWFLFTVFLLTWVVLMTIFAQVWVADTKMLRDGAEGPYRKEPPGVCKCR